MVMKRFLALGLVVSLLGVTVAQDKDKPPPAKPEAAPAKPQDKPVPAKPQDKPAPAQDKPATPPAPATTPAAGAEVELAWKFVKDQTFYQKLRTTTEQKMKVHATPTSTRSRSRSSSSPGRSKTSMRARSCCGRRSKPSS